MRLLGDAGIGEADCERVGGAPGDHAGEGDAAVGVEVYDIAIGWCANDAGKHPHARRVLASRHAPNELIDDAVEAPIVVERPAGIAGLGEGQTVRIEAQMFESAEVIPAPKLER